MILNHIFLLFAMSYTVLGAKHVFMRNGKKITFDIYNGRCADRLSMRYKRLRMMSRDKFNTSRFNATIIVFREMPMTLMATLTFDVCTRSKHRECQSLVSLENNFCDSLNYQMLKNISSANFTCPIKKGTYHVTNSHAEYMLEDYLEYRNIDQVFLRIREYVTDDSTKKILHCNEINIYADEGSN